MPLGGSVHACEQARRVARGTICKRNQPPLSGQADEVSFPLYGGIGNFNTFNNLHGHAWNDIFNA
jgi:hypothetical protein